MVDVIVIGGGIAGVSVAAELSETASVMVLESEPSLAYHTTGRSAALYFGSYGHSDVVHLTQASRAWFDDPPHTDHPVLSKRGALTLSFGADIPDHPGTSKISADEASALVPTIRTDLIKAAMWEPEAADMDVAAIHHAYVRQLRTNGGRIETSTPVTGLEHGRAWSITAQDKRFEADIVVNAAGAWCDRVAQLADVPPLGLIPKRRTAFMVTGPPQAEHWPLVTDVGHTFYFKPDGPQLLCSPADETPSEPCDAKPEPIDIALAIERINAVTDLGIRSVQSSWAGLRTFAPDASMVIGFEPGLDGFFWLAGQGGTGIQTAPAAARLAASMISESDRVGTAFDPARFR
jgi:D-arginine dehydrogenase